MPSEPCFQFVPSRVDGFPGTKQVVVWPDRLELVSANGCVAFRFSDIAEWPRPAWLWRRLARLGWSRRWFPVGERDWFHSPAERFFRFFTTPPLVIYMPDEPVGTPYGSTSFRRVQDVLLFGGFSTYDLG